MTRDGNDNLGDRHASQTDGCDYAPVLSALEEQLTAVDRLGSGIAAAHLDAAIQQLRLDRIRTPSPAR
jgi:hypothetical protein